MDEFTGTNRETAWEPDNWTFGKISLWQPQRLAVAGVEEQFAAGKKSTLVVSPTGSGKTSIIGAIAAREINRGGRVLMLAHREELILQAHARMADMGIEAAIEKAEQRIESHGNLFGGEPAMVIGTVQTIKGPRMARLPPDYFTMLVTDEAHHAVADSYQNIYKYFRQARHVGFTATADRADGENIGSVFGSLAYEYTLPAAVRDGRLCRIRVVQCETDIDLRNVRTTAGDLNAGDLEEVITPNIETLVNAAAAEVGNRKTLVFTPDVGSAYLTAKALRQVGITAEAVSAGLPQCPKCCAVQPEGGHSCANCGFEPKRKHCRACCSYRPQVFSDEPGLDPACPNCGPVAWQRGWKSRAVSSDERRKKLRDYAKGEFQALVNCALLLEGYDCKEIAAVVLMRPTKSRPLCCQMIGRGTRVAPGKDDLLVVDFAYNTGRHELVSPVKLYVPDGTDEEVVAEVERMAAAAPVDILTAMDEAARNVAERRKAAESRKHVAKRNDLDFKVYKKSVLYGRVEYDPLSIGAETIGANVESLMAIKGVPATEKQIATLEKLGVRAASSLSKTAAGQLMNKLVSRIAANLASLKQIAFLETLHRRAGVPYDKERMRTLKFDEASVMIGDLKKKLGWT